MDRSLRLGKVNSGERADVPVNEPGKPSTASTLIGVALLFCPALLLAAILFVFGIKTDSASAAAGGIGVAPPAGARQAPATSARLGARILREGMTGPDVRVLKGIFQAKNLLASPRLTETFDRSTTSAVRRFQKSENIVRSGIVNRATARALVGSLGTSEASWYGPGLYGNGTACGKVTLRPNTIGIAHKTLPCGTRVLIGYRGKFVIAPVIDRGPFIAGRTWDLTAAAAEAIGLTSAGIGMVRHAVITRGN